MILCLLLSLPGLQEGAPSILGAPSNFTLVADLTEAKENSRLSPEALKRVREELQGEMEQLVILSALDLNTLTPTWEVGSAKFPSRVSERELARAVGGYVDTIETEQIVWSPRNTYFKIEPGNKVLLLRPTNRQLLVNLLRATGQRDALQKAGTEAIAKAKGSIIRMELDLRNAVSSVAARKRMANLECFGGAKAAVEDVANLLGSVQGVTFELKASGSTTGVLRIQFTQSPTALASVGKALVIEILNRRGMAIDDLNSWKADVEGNAFVMQGEVSPGTVGDLFTLLTTPSAAAGVSATSQSESENQSRTSSIVPTTKKYFQSVQKLVTEVRLKTTNSLGERATWNDLHARRIENLPTLDVDSEAVDYADDVASLLRGSGLATRKAAINAGANRATNAGYASAYGFNSDYSVNVQAHREATRTSATNYKESLAQIDELTAKLRRKLTDKYQVQF